METRTVTDLTKLLADWEAERKLSALNPDLRMFGSYSYINKLEQQNGILRTQAEAMSRLLRHCRHSWQCIVHMEHGELPDRSNKLCICGRDNTIEQISKEREDD